LLADQVGLGKTIQLAMAALLIALEEPEGGPILVLAPKPLLKQWQGELKELLKLPSARWEGKVWIDENEISYPSSSNKALAKCPRKIGLVSQGIIQRGIPETLEPLLKQQYSCIIVDESHRARRRNVPAVDADEREVNEIAEPNKLLEFLRKIAEQTKSMLLATATPVQLHPVEAWDLLHLLSHGNESVLGGWTRTSPWYQPSRCLAVATGDQELPNEANDGWEFVRDPLPAKSEDIAFEKIRKNLDASDDQWQFKPEALDKLSPAIRKIQLVNNILPEFGRRFNPMLRCIVRRTRSYLEETINPATGSYYLPKVSVRLFGETEEGAMILGGYLRDAYQEAEQFSMLLQQRIKSAGFFKTLLLRRLGSSIEAGRNTIKKLLGENENDLSEEEEDDFEDEQVPHNLFGQFQNNNVSEFKQFTDEELNSLQRCLDLLEQAGSQDPKLEAILGYLEGEHINTEQPWKDLGCILFSQYYDTVRWVGDAIAGMPEWQDMEIGLYAGSNRSGIWQKGKFSRIDRDILKSKVRQGELKILFGTDAASEGLNLQKLGTLINIDLPWNPTRLEQRKGRIQRIGQSRNEVFIANLRYRDSVEDRVHRVLADRLEAIHDLFGQIPDTLEDVWVHMALQDEEKARQRIERTSETRNPFDLKYSHVEDADWESSPLVIDPFEVNDLLTKGW